MQLLDSKVNPYVVLSGGILYGASAVICVRLAQENGMPSLALATIRQIIAVAALAPLVLSLGHNEIAALTQQQWGLITLAGLMLGTHFLFFFYALEYAPVLTALAFGNMTPLFTAFIGWAVLSETINRKVFLGALLALVGIVVVGLAESTHASWIPYL